MTSPLGTILLVFLIGFVAGAALFAAIVGGLFQKQPETKPDYRIQAQ